MLKIRIKCTSLGTNYKTDYYLFNIACCDTYDVNPKHSTTRCTNGAGVVQIALLKIISWIGVY